MSFSDFLVSKDKDCTLHLLSEASSEMTKSYIMSLSSNKAITDQILLRIINVAILPIIVYSITHV